MQEVCVTFPRVLLALFSLLLMCIKQMTCLVVSETFFGVRGWIRNVKGSKLSSIRDKNVGGKKKNKKGKTPPNTFLKCSTPDLVGLSGRYLAVLYSVVFGVEFSITKNV